ncbi:MAG: efflux RND transporter permease subunit [Burkholderiaceae bacterium]
MRGVGLIGGLSDIESIVIKEAAAPLSTCATSRGAARRGGSPRRDGQGRLHRAVGGIEMIRGGNAKEVVERVKKRVDEINARGMPPGGLKIVPYYDRSEFVDAALWTVTKVLLEGVVFVTIVLFLFLGDLRSA